MLFSSNKIFATALATPIASMSPRDPPLAMTPFVKKNKNRAEAAVVYCVLNMFFLESFGMDSSMVLENCCAICATASCWDDDDDDDDDDEFAFTFGNSKFGSSG